jgi:hypothetical protein
VPDEPGEAAPALSPALWIPALIGIVAVLLGIFGVDWSAPRP